MPTLPTPTTWRTTSASVNRSKRLAAVLLEGQPVPGQQLVDQVGLLVVADGHPHGRVLGDARAARGPSSVSLA